MDTNCGHTEVNESKSKLSNQILLVNSNTYIHTLTFLILFCRLLGIKVVEDSDPAWFPEAELKEVHGIVPHEPTDIERTIFCFNMDGTEGMCCPKYGLPEKSLEEEDE